MFVRPDLDLAFRYHARETLGIAFVSCDAFPFCGRALAVVPAVRFGMWSYVPDGKYP